MKKFIILTFTFVCAMVLSIIALTGLQTNAEYLKDASGNTIYYPKSTTPISLPVYQVQDTEFRAAWVSPFAGDISGYSNDDQMKSQLEAVLDTLQEYNMNAIIFHIRTHNDALYPTDLAPQSGYVRGMDYEKFDYLEWFINECHSRGIEFHAWLNPYRISSNITREQITAKYQNYPVNPASDLNNVLLNSDGEAILDPGRPVVQDYIVDVCMEIVEKYDVDAIHFDDYFYINGVDDSKTRELYNTKLLGIEDFRRQSVDKFIEKLSNSLETYNTKNNKCVQLGISPSAIYRNISSYVAPKDYKWDNNGTLTYPQGTVGNGFAHYGSYLYCDTKKWIDNEWIDYIIPQVYNGFDTEAACYAAITEWWSGVVKNKDVQLYIGTGLYKKGSSSSGTWYTMESEWYNQLRFNQGCENVDGTSVYAYQNLVRYKNTMGNQKVMESCWTKDTKLPVVARYKGKFDSIKNKDVTGINVYKMGNTVALTWDKIDNTKNYVVYQYVNTLNINDPKQIAGLTGNDSTKDYVSFSFKYFPSRGTNFAIVPVTKSNETCKATVVNVSSATPFDNTKYAIASFNNPYITGLTNPGTRFTFRFYNAKANFGGALTYKVYYCYGTTWNDAEAKEASITTVNDLNSAPIPMHDLGYPVMIKLKASNDFGEMYSEPMIVNVDYKNGTGVMRDVLNFLNYMINDMFEENE